MSWSRFDDNWSDSPFLRGLSCEARWHYFALIQFCSRHRQYDGVVRTVDALRVSDVANPQSALSALVTVGALRWVDGGYVVVRIDDHLPPPHLRDETAKAGGRKRTQAWRERKCERGEHSRHCPAKTCPVKLGVAGDDVGDVSPTKVDDTSGQDGTGQGSPAVPTQRDDEMWDRIAVLYDR